MQYFLLANVTKKFEKTKKYHTYTCTLPKIYTLMQFVGGGEVGDATRRETIAQFEYHTITLKCHYGHKSILIN